MRLLPLVVLLILTGCRAEPETLAFGPPAPPPAEPAALVAPADTALADSLQGPAYERAYTLPEGFVYLRDVAPSIIQEIRYTTAFNFVGEPIDGYTIPECVLARPAAEALARVQDGLPEDLSLKVYDCYRPQRAVDHFVRWARSESRTMKQIFYPEEPKRSLFSRGYIASRSGHSRGATVDLTLVRLPHTPNTDYPDPATDWPPRCDRPLTGPTGPDIQGGGRFPEGDLDMGTAYDCFSPLSATRSGGVSSAVRANRTRLVEAMSAAGFRNYSKEWWHFTLRNEPYRRQYFDFPIE